MTQPSERVHDDLLRRMKRGDEEAFATIYRFHQGEIYRYALHMTGNPGFAEEVTQEVFMALIRKPERFDSTQGSLPAFLFGIGRNHVLRCLERERGYVAFGEGRQESGERGLGNGDCAPPDPLNDVVRQETVAEVREAVLSLPAAYREVVVLCDLQEKSYADAAESLACAIGTVRSRLHRARSLLARKLGAARQAHADGDSRVSVKGGEDASDDL